MPKYYRFRPISPTRDKGDMQKFVKTIVLSSQVTNRAEKSVWSTQLTPTQLWYLRRTTWREPLRAVREVMGAAARRQTLATRWVKASSRYAHASHGTTDKPSSDAQVWRFSCHCQLM